MTAITREEMEEKTKTLSLDDKGAYQRSLNLVKLEGETAALASLGARKNKSTGRNKEQPKSD